MKKKFRNTGKYVHCIQQKDQVYLTFKLSIVCIRPYLRIPTKSWEEAKEEIRHWIENLEQSNGSFRCKGHTIDVWEDPNWVYMGLRIPGSSDCIAFERADWNSIKLELLHIIDRFRLKEDVKRAIEDMS